MCLVRESFSCLSMSAKYTLYLPLSTSLASFLSMRNHIQSASLLPVSSSSCASSSLPCCAAGFYPLCSAPIGCTAQHRNMGCLPAIGCLVSLTAFMLVLSLSLSIGYSFFPLCYLAGLLLLASVSLVIIFLLLSFIRTCPERGGNIIFRCKFNASRLHASTGGHTISRQFLDTLS